MKAIISLLFIAFHCGSVFTQNNGSESQPDFPPNITYFSMSQEVALIGRNIELTCIFSGKPLPTITWLRPKNKLPSGRYSKRQNSTILVIFNINESDDGEYVCTATNANGTARYVHNIRVEALPIFKRVSDGPRDVNVTEGESMTFNCSAFAKPPATVAWFRNGQPIDVNNASNRLEFSNDSRSLTIRDVCRDCVDPESRTNQTVIQCNASNAHGYAIRSGLLNVLMRTNVTIRGTRNVSVDFMEEKTFVFQCMATSDPSTPPTVKWYKPWHKAESNDVSGRDAPPFVYVNNGLLVITIIPNCSVICTNFLGEYRCVGDNGHSRDTRTITLSFKYPPMPAPEDMNQSTTCTWSLLIVGAIGIVLFFIGGFLGYFRGKGLYGSKGRKKDRKLSTANMDENVDYESIGIHLERIGSYERPMPRGCSMYDYIGYESIDQMLEEIRDREGAMPQLPHLPHPHRNTSYKSIDRPRREAFSRGRPMLDEDTKYDDMGYIIPLQKFTTSGKLAQNQVHNCEEVRNESKKFPDSNEHSDASDTYSGLTRKEEKFDLDLVPDLAEVDPYLELFSKEVNTYMGMGPKEETPYMDMSRKETDSDRFNVSSCTPHHARADYLVHKN